MRPFFSIIVPTYNRADGRLQTALRSVKNQWFNNFECIVVDDGSGDDTDIVVNRMFKNDPYRFRYVYMENNNRVIARNAGMKRAKGDWFCWLDSDDALDPMYLAQFAQYIKTDPDARLWVCGVQVNGMRKDDHGNRLNIKWQNKRDAWMPPVNSDGAHEHFPSGKVGTGAFVFHRECYEKIGPFPPWRTHLDIADGIDEWLGYETGYSGDRKWVGNPWGDDYAYFRKLTMFYRVHLITVPPTLYVQYIR